jgi:hypothetical protein
VLAVTTTDFLDRYLRSARSAGARLERDGNVNGVSTVKSESRTSE